MSVTTTLAAITTTTSAPAAPAATTTTTSAPTTTTTAEPTLPKMLWVIITGDHEHLGQEYQRPFVTGAYPEYGEWDETRPIYYGLSQARSNLQDFLWWDKEHWHVHSGSDPLSNGTGYLGQWTLMASPYITDWSGNFFRKDLSYDPTNAIFSDNYNPIGIYSGKNPSFTEPPGNEIANVTGYPTTYAEVMHCDSCEVGTGWAVTTNCVMEGEFANYKPFIPPNLGNDFVFSCGGGNVWNYEFFMSAEEDPEGTAPVHMTFVGTGYNGEEWYPNAKLVDVDCQQVDSPFGDYKVTRCFAAYPAIWTGVRDEDGTRYRYTFSSNPSSDANEGNGCTGNAFSNATSFYPEGVFMGADNIVTGGGWSLVSESLSDEDPILDGEQGDTLDYCCPLYSSSSQGVQGYAGAINPATLRSYANAWICCPKGLEFYLAYPGKTFTIDMPETMGGPICPNADTNISVLKGGTIPFDMKGFGIACECCRPCTPEITQDEDGQVYMTGTCIGAGPGMIGDPFAPLPPTTTPPPGTTPVPATTLYPPSTTTTTPDPDQYICVSSDQAPFAGTYEKANWQYNDKPQWSKSVGSTYYWVYFHEKDGWSVTDNPVAPNIWKSPSELSAEKPWNVSSFNSSPPGMSLSVSQGAC